MNKIEREDRVQNWPRKEWRQSCESCGDDGLLAVMTRDVRGHPVEEMGPCPFCLKGLQVEFPEGKTGTWGNEGFWRGRDIPGELVRHWRENQPLPAEENLRRMRELQERMAIISAGGDPGEPSWGY